jgi:hypothetical protein
MRLRRSGPTAVLGGVSMRRWVVLGCAVLCSSRRADGLAACRSASSRDDGEGEGAGGGRGGSGICPGDGWPGFGAPVKGLGEGV